MSAAESRYSSPRAASRSVQRNPADVEPSEVQALRTDVDQAGSNVQRFEAQLADCEAQLRDAEDSFHRNPEGASAPKLEAAERRVREARARLNAERRRLEALGVKLGDPTFRDLARQLDELREQGANVEAFWTDAEPDLARFHELGAEVARAWEALVAKLDGIAEPRGLAQAVADQIDAKADIGGPDIRDLVIRAGRAFFDGVKSTTRIDNHVAESFRREPAGRRLRRVGVIDASSGKHDTFAAMVAGWSRHSEPRAAGETVEHTGARLKRGDGDRLLVVDWLDAIDAKRARRMTAADVVARLARRFRESGVETVHGDQREAFTLKSAFQSHGLRFVEHPWTSTNKARAVAHVRRWFSDGLISLPEHHELRRQLLAYEEHAASGGRLRYSHRGASHDDLVALLVTLALAEQSRRLPGSPGRESTYVRPSPGRPSAAALAGFVDPPRDAERRRRLDDDLALDDRGRLQVVPRSDRESRPTRSGNDWGNF